jgi:hypothetical protein
MRTSGHHSPSQPMAKNSDLQGLNSIFRAARIAFQHGLDRCVQGTDSPQSDNPEACMPRA